MSFQRKILILASAILGLIPISQASANDQVTCKLNEKEIVAQYDSTTEKLTYTISQPGQPNQVSTGVQYQEVRKDVMEGDPDLVHLATDVAHLDWKEVGDATAFVLVQSDDGNDGAMGLFRFNNKAHKPMKTVFLFGGITPSVCE